MRWRQRQPRVDPRLRWPIVTIADHRHYSGEAFLFTNQFIIPLSLNPKLAPARLRMLIRCRLHAPDAHWQAASEIGTLEQQGAMLSDGTSRSEEGQVGILPEPYDASLVLILIRHCLLFLSRHHFRPRRFAAPLRLVSVGWFLGKGIDRHHATANFGV